MPEHAKNLRTKPPVGIIQSPEKCIEEPHSRFRQEQLSPLTYLTYPEWFSGFTVTDSPGFSPDSVPCPQQVEEKELYGIKFIYYTA